MYTLVLFYFTTRYTMEMMKVCRLIVIMSLVRQGLGVPVPHSWTIPCGGSVVSTRTILRCGNFSEELLPKVTYIHNKTTQMIRIFESPERGISRDGLNGNDFSGMIPGLPTPSDIRAGMTPQNRTENLVQDYRTISTYVVFIEQIIVDEKELDPDVHSITVLTKWRHIRQKLLDLLCDLNREIIAHHHRIPHITSDVMSDSVRNQANLSRYHFRDYIVLQLLKRVIEEFTRKYSI